MEKRTSPYNAMGWPHQTAKRNIVICDVTLRDGEQTAGVSFSIDEKVKAARLLDDIGAGQIQTGVIRTQEDFDTAKALVALDRKNAKIETMTTAFSPQWRQQIEKAVEAGSDIVHTLIPLSPYMRGMYASAPNDAYLFEHTAEAIAFMRECGAPCINVSLLDATRASGRC